jgi:hypothetical protein
MYIGAFLFLVLLRSWKLKRHELDLLTNTNTSESSRDIGTEGMVSAVHLPGKFHESARYLISWGKV